MGSSPTPGKKIMPRYKRRGKLEKIDTRLKRVLRRLNLEYEILSRKILDFWPEVVGEKVSLHTEAEKVKDGILFVRVDNPVWSNELRFYKNDYIKKLNEKVEKKIIKEIQFRIK